MSHLSSGIQSLPDELVIAILLHLDCRGVLRSSQTCRRLHAIVAASQALQYIVELSLTGAVDGQPACPLNIGERLQLLRARKRRRREFQPELALSFGIDCPTNDYVYDYVDGIFAIHYFVGDPGAEVSHLVAYDLSSATGSETPLFHTQLDFLLLDFSIDPSRDLIVCAELIPDHDIRDNGPDVYIHLRTLSSGGMSPPVEARRSRLEVTDDTLTDPEDISLHLASDMAAYFSQSTLYIWRWTTGSLLVCWEDLLSHHDWLNSFAFVSPHSFVITQSGTERGSLRLYALPSDDTAPTSESPEDRQNTRFYLPDLKSAHPAILSVVAGPFSTPCSAATNPEDSILMIFLTDLNPRGRVRAQLCFVVRTSLFERNLPSAQHISSITTPPQHIRRLKWTDWGPENSRLLPYITDSMHAARGAYGSRMFLPLHSDDNPEDEMVHTYFDFADTRDHVFLEARQTGAMPLGSLARTTKMRTTFKREISGSHGLFKKHTDTLLPYHSTEMTWTKGEDEVLLGDERFVRKTWLSTGKLQLDVYDF
ncbi:unnamed protein product [Peniophora sp. CBMAI 1063]|nr:unnamed protein product [Peniophora sp. CBMAI 1063]